VRLNPVLAAVMTFIAGLLTFPVGAIFLDSFRE